MPLSIWITKADSYAAAHTEAVRALKEPLGPVDAQRLLDRGELDDLLDLMNATPHAGDHAHWLPRPKSREAWCSVFTTPHEGPLRHVELSASYSNPEFMRNMLDMFDLALAIARKTGGRVFEETAGTLITKETIDAFLSFEGAFVRGQHDFFKSGQRQLQQQSYAPLEYPLGAIDQVSDFMVFQLATKGEPPPLAALVAGVPETLKVHTNERSAVLIDRATDKPAVWVIRVEDGVVVRPYYAALPFQRLAAETFAAVERLEQRLGAQVSHLGKIAAPDARTELKRHAQGLGVELYEWLIGATQQ
jgi:hypothetical protein